MDEGRVDAVKRSGDSIFIVKCGSESLGFRLQLCERSALGDEGLAHDGVPCAPVTQKMATWWLIVVLNGIIVIIRNHM